MTLDEYFAALRERGWAGFTDHIIEFIATGIVAFQFQDTDEAGLSRTGEARVVKLLCEPGHEGTAFVEIVRRVDAGEWEPHRSGTGFVDLTKWDKWPAR